MAVTPVPIVGLGASTPVGRTVWASVAAARAGVCGFSDHPFMIDTAGEPMRVSRVPWLDVDVQGIPRYLALLCPALEEALAGIRRVVERDAPRVGLALALPSARPGRPADLGHLLSAAVCERYFGVFASTVVVETGHAAGYAALDAAMKGIRHQSVDVCVVAGVDSYLSPETLEWIEACDQLHGAGQLNNAWGFIPGEAASALVVGSPAWARDTAADVYGEVVGVGLGHETNLIKTDSVCVGEGLTEAFRAALGGLAPPERIHNVFCDLNGETYRADEYGFSVLRTTECFRAPGDFVAPADCWGDVGAAGAALHVAMGVIATRKGYAQGPNSLVWAGSETGERGAAVIRGAELQRE